ncbi:hypothetical protein Taro_011755 [Colocasia esculenta]|uniref:Uncharacterized protein n=1 Tax=Colocasia esculenta TaxID=4460 RepID=A0A843UH21_COLES|nr:hypothetical protein [Colocasia esculenta]
MTQKHLEHDDSKLSTTAQTTTGVRRLQTEHDGDVFYMFQWLCIKITTCHHQNVRRNELYSHSTQQPEEKEDTGALPGEDEWTGALPGTEIKVGAMPGTTIEVGAMPGTEMKVGVLPGMKIKAGAMPRIETEMGALPG